MGPRRAYSGLQPRHRLTRAPGSAWKRLRITWRRSASGLEPFATTGGLTSPSRCPWAPDQGCEVDLQYDNKFKGSIPIRQALGLSPAMR